MTLGAGRGGGGGAGGALHLGGRPVLAIATVLVAVTVGDVVGGFAVVDREAIARANDFNACWECNKYNKYNHVLLETGTNQRAFKFISTQLHNPLIPINLLRCSPP